MCERLYLEVGGVHTQGEGVQLAQVEETSFQIIDFGHGVSNGVHDGDSVLLGGGRGGALVLPVGEVGLGLRVHGEHPGLQKERKTWVVSEKVCVHESIWELSYTPAESTGSNGLSVGRHYSPEGPDGVLVLGAETRHLDFVGFNTTKKTMLEGVFMLEKQRGHTQDHLQDRPGKAYLSHLPLCEITTAAEPL